MKLISSEDLKKLVFIHYGSNRYNAKLFRNVRNSPLWCKPERGGLWASPINSSRGWKDWCEREEFRTFGLKRFFTFQLDNTSKVLLIDEYGDLEHLSVTKETQTVGLRTFKGIDFENMFRKGFDAILLTDRGESATRWMRGPLGSLYGWDCESLLVLNKKKIINPISQDHIKREIYVSSNNPNN